MDVPFLPSAGLDDELFYQETSRFPFLSSRRTMMENIVKYYGHIVFSEQADDLAAQELAENKDKLPLVPMEPVVFPAEFLCQLIHSLFLAMQKSVRAVTFIADLRPRLYLVHDRPFYLSESFPWTAEYASRRDYVRELLDICNQAYIQRWDEMSRMVNVSQAIKIGEGAFCEVFIAEYMLETVILKVMPISEDIPVGLMNLSGASFREAAAKLVFLSELTDLRRVENGYSTDTFVKLKGAIIVKGSYPVSMIAAWEEYKRKVDSFKMHPIYFSAHQNYLLIAVENGGINLENYEICTMLQAYSIVYQLIMAIAVAECRLHFEHRDLNYENILITITSWDDIMRCHFNGSAVDIHTYGVRVKILNSSFCRMTKDMSSIYFDWASNLEFFNGTRFGPQREIYYEHLTFQAMRTINNNIWRPFWPVTNVLWVGYIVDCIYHRLERSRISCSLARRAFLDHFQHLHGYANLWTWVRDHIGTHMKREIVEVRGTQQP